MIHKEIEQGIFDKIHELIHDSDLIETPFILLGREWLASNISSYLIHKQIEIMEYVFLRYGHNELENELIELRKIEKINYDNHFKRMRKRKNYVHKMKTKREEMEMQKELKKIKLKEPKKTYLMKDLNTGLYKIGRSKNPAARESTLQSEKPTIKMVKVWEEDIEKELHRMYEKERVRGEWFNLSEIQVKFITSKP